MIAVNLESSLGRSFGAAATRFKSVLPRNRRHSAINYNNLDSYNIINTSVYSPT